MLTYNHSVLTNNGSWLTDGSVTPPGPTFDSVTIGSQTWMSKNLTIDDGQGGIYTQTINYGEGDVVEYYYTWDAAVRIAASIPGWHLPTQAEWNTLAAAAGGCSKLMSTYGWSYNNGTDNFGFTALPAGNRSSSGTMKYLYTAAYFWTATNGPLSTQRVSCYFNSSEDIKKHYHIKSYYIPVRLIKD